MRSADTQDSNVLGGAVMAIDRRGEDDDGSGNTLADLPPSYTSKSATLPVGHEEMGLDDDRDWGPGHHEPVRSIEFAEDSEDEVPDFRDSPLTHSDMARSGSSQLAPVTETAIDDDYELIHVHPSGHHHDLVHDPDIDPRDHHHHSPAMASFHHPSRHASPAPSDSSASRHHTPVEPRPVSRGGPPRAHHKPPPPPPPPRRHHLEGDVPRLAEDVPVPAELPFDPFESLPPPAEMMLPREELEEEDVMEEDIPGTDLLHYDDDDPASSSHRYWPGSKPSDV